MNKHHKHFLDHILDVEGGFTDDSSDSGGATNYGITVSVARRHGYNGKMENLPKEKAIDIYLKSYWHAMSLDNVVELAPGVAYKLADVGVNMGVGRSSEFLQRCLNVLNNCGKLYPDITIDGDIGPKTIGVLYAFLKSRGTDGEKILLEMLTCLQGAFYIELAERRQKDEKFIVGWFRRIFKGRE